MVDKVRTRRVALAKVLEMEVKVSDNQPVHLGVMHARDPQSVQNLMENAKKIFNYKDAELADLSVSPAINFGPGTVGLVLYPAE